MYRVIMASVVFAAIGVMSIPGTATAGFLAPHKPSEVVQLTTGGNVPPCAAGRAINQRINGDGTSSSFTIPAGLVLVVTQIEVENLGGIGTPGNLVGAALYDANTSLQLTPSPSGVVDPAGNFHADEAVANVVIKSGVVMCATAPNPLTLVRVIGFLAKDR